MDGYQAIGLCRYRDGYVNGDLERIEVQHQFLKAVANQFISLGNIRNIGKVSKILAESMDTNLSAANIAYFIRQALMQPGRHQFLHCAKYTSGCPAAELYLP